MRIKNWKLILLIIIGLLTFIIGMRYELDYRILTRRTVKYFADYELNFYGGKDFRIFEPDIAFILTLFPIGFYFTIRKISSVKKILCLNLVYLILIPVFYSFFLLSRKSVYKNNRNNANNEWRNYGISSK